MNYPQPPFKKYVKTANGTVLEVGNKNSYLDKNGNWEIEHEHYEMLSDKKNSLYKHVLQHDCGYRR